MTFAPTVQTTTPDPGVLDDHALRQLFLDARTQNAWTNRPVSTAQLHRIVDLMKMAPTSANCCPVRIVFITTPEAKERLRPALAEGNVAKTLSAPVIALMGYDLEFYDQLPKLFPHADAKSWFVGNEALIQDTAFRNSSLQGAYLMLAARAIGLDCGPMSGFNKAIAEKEFFSKETIKANFLCNLGYGDSTAVFPRSPRFAFEDFCSIA